MGLGDAFDGDRVDGYTPLPSRRSDKRPAPPPVPTSPLRKSDREGAKRKRNYVESTRGGAGPSTLGMADPDELFESEDEDNDETYEDEGES